MKKIIFTFLILIGSLCTSKAQIFTFSIWSIENDTATQGGTFKLRINGSPTLATDTGRIYLHQSPSSYIELFEINLNDLSTLPLVSGAREITVTLPAGIKGSVDFQSNGDNSVFFGCFLRANSPDMELVPVPGINGPLSGNSGYNINLKFMWTYESITTDTIRMSLDGLEIYKIALSEIENDSTINFPITGTPNTYLLTCNYGIPDFGYYITINQTPVTNIVSAFVSTEKKDIIYYDILGRIVAPKEGDLIRYTPYGAIIY